MGWIRKAIQRCRPPEAYIFLPLIQSLTAEGEGLPELKRAESLVNLLEGYTHPNLEAYNTVLLLVP